MRDFFVSYNKEDKQWAEWVAWQLEEGKYTVAVQAWDFRAGSDFVNEMQNAVTQTQKTIAVLSENYLKAEFTQPEWFNAFARDPLGNYRTLIPVRVAMCRPSGLLATRIYVDLVGLSEREAKEMLLASLAVRGKPLKPPAFPGKNSENHIGPLKSKVSFPGIESKSLAVWSEKLEFLREYEPLIVAAEEKIAIKKQIEEALRKIAELDVATN